MDFLTDINNQKQQNQLDRQKEQRHKQKIDATKSVETAVKDEGTLTRSIIKSHQPKVTVKNQIKGYATTQDIDKLSKAIASAVTALSQEGANITQEGYKQLEKSLEAVTKAISSLNNQTSAKSEDNTQDIVNAVKNLQKSVTKKENVTVTNLDDLADFFFSLEQAVVNLKLDPKIDVQAPVVEVSAPELDLTPVAESIQGLELPDNAPVIKKLELVNSTLNKILNRPIPVSNGGGGSTFQPTKDFDYIGITSTSSTKDTLTFKSGGASGTTVRTLVVTFAAGADKISDDLSSLEYS